MGVVGMAPVASKVGSADTTVQTQGKIPVMTSYSFPTCPYTSSWAVTTECAHEIPHLNLLPDSQNFLLQGFPELCRCYSPHLILLHLTSPLKPYVNLLPSTTLWQSGSQIN